MTFEEVYKFLYKKYKIVSFDYSDKIIRAKDSITISTFDLFDLIDGLKETYAPKIKMTIEQRNKFMIFISEDEEFEDFWYCYGYGRKLYKEFTEKELIRAWLYPELIEVVDD